jgi:PAS domain S-box-containing protein
MVGWLAFSASWSLKYNAVIIPNGEDMDSISSTPPHPTDTSSDPRRELTASLLRKLLQALLVLHILGFGVLIPFLALNKKLSTLFLLLTAVFMLLIPYILFRRGRVKGAAWFLAATGTVLMTGFALLDGGVRFSGVGTQLGMAVVAVVLLGPGAMFLALGALVADLGMAALEAAGFSWKLFPAPPIASSFVILMVFVVVLPIVDDAVRHLGRALEMSRKQLWEQQQAREQIVYQAQLIAQAPDPVVAADNNRVVTFWNAAAAGLFEWPEKEALGKPLDDVLHFSSTISGRRCQEELARSGSWMGELPMLTRSGEPIVVGAAIARLHNAAGEPVGTVAGLRDITDRKRAEEALIEERHLLHTLMDNLPDHIYFKDCQSRFIRLNKAMGEWFGLSDPAQALGKTDFDFFSDEHAQQAYADEQEVIRTGQPIQGIEEKETWPDGRETWVSTTKMPLRDAQGRIIGTFGVSRDTTARKRAEQALRESEEKYHRLFSNALDAILIFDKETHRFIDANEAATKLYSYPHEELVGMRPEHLSAEPEQTTGTIHELERTGSVRVLMRWHHKKDGTVFPVEFTAWPFTWKNREVVCVFVRDITERKRAEEALAASEQRYRELFENAMDIVFTYDLRGNFTSLNRVGEKTGGYTCAELASMNVLQILAPEYVEEGRRVLEGLAAGREPGIGEWEIVTKDGRRVWLEASLRLVRRNGELAEVQGIARDITERKQAEEQLRHYLAQLHALAARLQSVREEERARVAREIHDELGQDLTAIKIELTSILGKLGEKAKSLSAPTESILKRVDQTIRTVRRIATELRPGILDDLGLTAAIEWATEEFQARTGIKCHLELWQEHIVLDRERTTAIFRIFQETLTNVARHSGATELQVRLFRQNASTVLEVRDNGVGIQPQHFTSPASLGISGMRERALVLDGEFEIGGRPGEGTRVTVRIPDLSSAVKA